VALVGVAPERQDARVLKEQELIVDPILGPGTDQPALERPCRPVRHAAKPAHLERRAGCRGLVERQIGRRLGDHAGTIAGEHLRSPVAPPGRSIADDGRRPG
jgi:hypothetical protein